MKLSLAQYLERKAQLTAGPSLRAVCWKCRKAQLTCYCSLLHKQIFTSPRMVILMHPLEAKHPVGTGRLTHRCLGNSQLIVGQEFSASPELRAILQNPALAPLLLFPGARSLNLSSMSSEARQELWRPDQEAVVIVLDATWHLAKKMLHRTPQLQNIPRISFTPSRLSRFRVRKQPREECFSTLEAVHEVLTLLQGPTDVRDHDYLLEVFDQMVEKQLSFRAQNRSRHSVNYFARKARRANNKRLKTLTPNPELPQCDPAW